jgi:MarR family transcriptional regulator, transcriptional regulator for hemolysin
MQTFDRDPMILLHDVARIMRTRFDQRARASGMTRAQWVILARLSRQPGLSQNEMALICEVEPITVGRLIDRLEARGFVERRADPDDRRIRRLHLLPAAQPILDEIARCKDELNLEVFDGMSEQDKSLLVDSLIHIKGNLNTDNAGVPQMAVGG